MFTEIDKKKSIVVIYDCSYIPVSASGWYKKNRWNKYFIIISQNLLSISIQNFENVNEM